MTNVYTATSLQAAPESERRARMIKYTVAMLVRLACIGACFVVEGWWLLLPALGAVILPYFAVILATSVTPKPPTGGPLRPGTMSVVSPK